MRLSRFPFPCPLFSSLCAFNPPSASSCCVYPTCRSLCLFYHLQFMCQISLRAAGPISCQSHIRLPFLVPPGLDISRVLIQTASRLPLPHSPASLGSVSPLCFVHYSFPSIPPCPTFLALPPRTASLVGGGSKITNQSTQCAPPSYLVREIGVVCLKVVHGGVLPITRVRAISPTDVNPFTFGTETTGGLKFYRFSLCGL